MPDPGRNAPCPCGSGRKFKNCCLARHQEPSRAYTQEERESALAKLARFSQRDEFQDDAYPAPDLFWGGRLELMSDTQREECQSDQHLFHAFLHWVCFDWVVSGTGDTIASRFLSKPGNLLTLGERTWLERMNRSCLRPYEVVAVRLEEGLDLKDLWTDGAIAVKERLGTRQLQRWDVLVLRVIEGPQGQLEIEGSPFRFQAGSGSRIVDELRRQQRWLKAHRALPGDPVDFFKRVGQVFNHLWLDLVAAPPLPTMVTAERDPVVFTKVVFDLQDRAGAEQALRNHPDIDVEDPDRYVWVQPLGEQNRILGQIELRQSRLTIDTVSERRAEQARALVESLLGSSIRFRATVSQDVRQALEDAPRAGREEPCEMPAEVEQEIVTRYLDKHYRSWLDESIPALGGRTPRKAATLKTVRPRLIDLLKELESGMAQNRQAGQPWIDLSWLWKELGIERP